MQYFLSLDYHFHHEYVITMIINDTNKDIEYIKEELSIENIVLSIRKLKEQVKRLQATRAPNMSQPDHI